jgi:phosphoribosylformimino-5-aminoimidazole carboxamide ribotide isomerase
VILGSGLIQNGVVNVAFAKRLSAEFGPEKLVFAIDARGGKVAIRGWREVTAISPLQMIQALDAFCCSFLYTHIETEGLMAGLPLEPVRELRRATTRQLIAAGGITTQEEIEQLQHMGVDAVVGMALYAGRLTQSV